MIAVIDVLSVGEQAKLAKKHEAAIAGSTSSLTGILVQIWCLLHPDRIAKLNMEALSSAFSEKVRFCSLALKSLLLSSGSV